jgi:hypothetical protein
MPTPPRRTLRRLAFASLWLAAACATPPPHVVQSFPSYADLRIESKPVPTIDILTSERAAADYDVAVEAWGARGWQAVTRICEWAKAIGAPQLDCSHP